MSTLTPRLQIAALLASGLSTSAGRKNDSWAEYALHDADVLIAEDSKSDLSDASEMARTIKRLERRITNLRDALDQIDSMMRSAAISGIWHNLETGMAMRALSQDTEAS